MDFFFFSSQKKPFSFISLVADTSLAAVVHKFILLIDGNQKCCTASCPVFETTEVLGLSTGSHCEQALESSVLHLLGECS